MRAATVALMVFSGCVRTSPAPATAAAPPSSGLVAHVDAAEPASPAPPADIGVEFGVRRLESSYLCEAPRLPPNDAGASRQGAPGVAHLHGTVDKEQVRQAIQSHLLAVKGCYEAILDGKPPYPQGKVRVRFAFDGRGVVQHSCVIESTLKNEYGERCIVDAVLRWRDFPKPVGGGWVVVDYPFVLVPAGHGK